MSPSFSIRAAAIAVLCALTACDEPASKTWPTGTAFALDGMQTGRESVGGPDARTGGAGRAGGRIGETGG